MEEREKERSAAADMAGLAIIALTIVFAYIFLMHTWVCDDAYITFRVVDNLLNGYGPVWNVAERVQVYTNPLWMFVVTGFTVIFQEIYYATLIASFAACAVLLVMAFKRLGNPLRMVFFFALVISSKAFCDYTSSGLENPLIYLLLGIFYLKYLSDFEAGKEPARGDIYFYLLVASLAFVNRMDTILLYLPPLIHLLIKGIRQFRWGMIKVFLLGTLPASLWLLFATVYYGFPLPNTYYAKVAIGMPLSLVFKQGIAYILNSINFDPITITAVALAVGFAILYRRLYLILAASSALLYLLYVMRVGGDFMAGRFLAAPFLLAAVLLVLLLKEKKVVYAGLAFLLIYNFVAPLAPIKSGPDYDQAWNWRLQNGVHDERGAYHKGTNLLFYDPFKRLRDRDWHINGHQGVSLRASGLKAFQAEDVGMTGYYAGPGVHIIDPMALTDPLLARMQPTGAFYFDFAMGNVRRDIPEGYFESCLEGKNLIKDPRVHEYYDGLLRIIRGPVFSWQRFLDIIDYNLGGSRQIAYRHPAQRNIIASIRASHHRFQTYVGKRLDAEGELVSDGTKEGFLQMGPYIPLEAGKYAVEWVGSFDEEPAGPIGFVDVCYAGGKQVIVRKEIEKSEKAKRGNLLARIEFQLDRFIEDIEYRFYVRKGIKVTLGRIVLIER
jgi:arabinofuranosyltransferase